MDDLGRIAVLIDGNDDYFYYYQLTEERVVRVTEDGVAVFNAYWEEDVLTEDLEWLMKERGFEIEYMDDYIVDLYLNDDEFEERFSNKVIKELKRYRNSVLKEER